jgi:hypothetical protein
MLVRRADAEGKLRPVEEISLEVDGLRSVADLRGAVQAALAPLYGDQGTEGFRIVHEKRDGGGLTHVGANASLKDVLRAKRLQVLLHEAHMGHRGAPAAVKPAASKPGVAKPKSSKRDRRRREGGSLRSAAVEADVELGVGR